MFNKLKKIHKNELLKVSSLNAVATSIKLLTSFVSVKIIAILIGPSGIALLGQLSNFSSILLTISTGGINNGVTKFLAENRGSSSRKRLYLRTSFWVILTLSGICALVLIIGSSAFSKMILKDVKFQSIFIVFGCTIFLYALNSLIIAILNGYKEFRKIVSVNIFNSIFGLIFSVVLVYFGGIYGALLSIVTYQSFIFIVTLFLISKSEWLKTINFIGKFNWQTLKRLSHYSLMALLSAISVPVCQLIVRSFITSKVSVTAAGVWEGMNRISSLYLMVITTSLSIYYLPKLSELKSDKEIRSEVINTYKIVIPVILLMSLAIYLSKGLIIEILFNKDFQNMRELFLFQLIGDSFKIFSWVLAYLFIAKTMTRHYVITEILFTICQIGLSTFFVTQLGSIGAPLAYMLNYIWYFIMMIWIFRKLLFPQYFINNKNAE